MILIVVAAGAGAGGVCALAAEVVLVEATLISLQAL